MSDVVAVMNDGEIMQEASPFDIYESPANRFVASFIGQTNFLDGTIETAAGNGSAHGAVETPCGLIRCVLADDMRAGDAVTVVIRPEDVHVSANAETIGADGDNVIEGEVREFQFLGEAIDAKVGLGDLTLRLKLHPSTRVRAGESIRLAISVERCRALAR